MSNAGTDLYVDQLWVKVKQFRNVVVLWSEVEKRGLVRSVSSSASAPFTLCRGGETFPVAPADLELKSLNAFLTHVCEGMRGEMGVIFGVLSPIERVHLMRVTVNTFLQCRGITHAEFGEWPYDEDLLLIHAQNSTSVNGDMLIEEMKRAKTAVLDRLGYELGRGLALPYQQATSPEFPAPMINSWRPQTHDGIFDLMNRINTSAASVGKPKKPTSPIIEVKKFNPASKRRIKHE